MLVTAPARRHARPSRRLRRALATPRGLTGARFTGTVTIGCDHGERDQSAGRAPALGVQERGTHARSPDRGPAPSRDPRRRASGRRAGAVDARPRPPARRVAARHRRRLRAARRRGLPDRSARAPVRASPRTPPPSARRRDDRRVRRRACATTSARSRPISRRSRARPGCARCALRSRHDRRRARLRRPARGRLPLRPALAEYLGRVRGVVADPERDRRHARLRAGARASCAARWPRRRRDAHRDGGPEQRWTTRRSSSGAGLELVPIGVDDARPPGRRARARRPRTP